MPRPTACAWPLVRPISPSQPTPRALIEDATRELGRVDVLVNNAGIQHVAPVHEFPVERWRCGRGRRPDRGIADHACGAAANARSELQQDVDIASVHGLVASVDKSAYVASKHGVVGFTKAVSLETATTGITCNAICPGWVLTPLVQKQIDALAAREKLDPEEAKVKLLGEKQPSSNSPPPSDSARSPYSSVRTPRRSSTAWRCRWTVAGSHDDVGERRETVIQNAPNSFPSAMTTVSAINGPTSPTIMISR